MCARPPCPGPVGIAMPGGTSGRRLPVTTTQQIEADILRERLAFLDADAAGNQAEADKHEAAMNRHLEEFIHQPQQRHGSAY